VILKVEDNGLGIDLKRHGNKLFGLHKTFHRHPEARGVGLYLTKTQVEAMGGSIYAQSELGIGTTFNVKF
jgi:sensor histidine kinase regulating citrate/malate metabolism